MTKRTSMPTISMHAAWPAILIPADGFCWYQTTPTRLFTSASICALVI